MFKIVFLAALATAVIVSVFNQADDITNNTAHIARQDMDYPVQAVREDSSVHAHPTYADDD